MQSNSALQLINSAAVADAAAAEALAAKKGVARIPTPREQLAQQQFTALNQSYGSADVSDATRRAYTELGKSYPVGKGSTSHGKAVWVSLNMLRSHLGLDPLMNPPRTREAAAILPDYSLTATVSVSGDFRLTVMPDVDFSVNRTLVTATNALTAGTMAISRGQYQVLEADDNLITSGVSIGPAWLAAYENPPAVGTRIGVCLMPVSPLGFPGVPIYHDVLVTAAP